MTPSAASRKRATAATGIHGGIEFISGIELAVEDDNGRFHLLGYLFDQDDSELADTLVALRRRRAARNEKIPRESAGIAIGFSAGTTSWPKFPKAAK